MTTPAKSRRAAVWALFCVPLLVATLAAGTVVAAADVSFRETRQLPTPEAGSLAVRWCF